MNTIFENVSAGSLPQPLRDALFGVCLVGVTALVWLGIAHPVVAPALALVPIIIIGAFRNAFLLGIGFILFSFFRVHEVLPVLMPLKLPLLLALGTVATLGWNIALGKTQPFWTKRFLPFLLFFLLVTFSIPLASSVSNSMGYWKDTYVKIAIMVFALAWLIRQERDFAMLMRAIIATALLVAIVALMNKANGIGLVEGTRVTIGRDIGSMLGDPNDLSLVLLFGAGMAGSTAMTRGLSPLERFFGLAVFIAIGAAIIATQSRGGLLGIAAVGGLFAQRRIKSKVLVGVIGAMALLVLHAAADVSNRKSGGAHEEGIDESAMGRIHAWETAANMAIRNPITGVGLNNFIHNYFDYTSHWDGKNHAVHSTWFGVAAETGVLGLGLFIWMVSSIYFGIKTASQRLARSKIPIPRMVAVSDGLLSGLAGFCVSGTFLTQGFVWPIYIMLAVMVAMNRFVEEEVQETAPE